MRAYSKSLHTIDELCAQALLPRDRLDTLADVAARYAVAITPAIADLIDRDDPHDPIARQFVPDAHASFRSSRQNAPIRSPNDPFSPVTRASCIAILTTYDIAESRQCLRGLLPVLLHAAK